MKKLYLLLFIISFLSCNHPESEKYERYKSRETVLIPAISEDENHVGYKVIGIKDGDTFVLLIDGKEQTIRLAHIDCPEKKQPFGNKAKQFASDICFGKYVIVINNHKFDRNKRLIAELILSDGRNINKEILRNGLAWHFKKYSDSNEYAVLEMQARSNKLGVWSEPNPIAPWDWRKGMR